MKIIYLMGKSASGKDTIYKKIREAVKPPLREIVLYTTRPIRDHERNGREYYFVDKEAVSRMEKDGKIIEKRVYHTVYGEWVYMTVDDGQFQQDGCYLTIGTLESYLCMREYFGSEVLIPVYLEVEDGLRLERAIAREKTQKVPKYEEMCRRFLADQRDFSQERLQEAGIRRKFSNVDVEKCTEEVLAYLREMMKQK